MPRYRVRRKRRSVLPVGLILIAACFAVWRLYPRDEVSSTSLLPAESLAKPRLTSDRPETVLESVPAPGVPEKGERTAIVDAVARKESPSRKRIDALVDAGRQALQRDDPVAARAHFSEALEQCELEDARALLRAELTRIGRATIFSHRIFPNDPLVERYVVKPGDTLGKIAKSNKVSAALLSGINDIADQNLIRAGQSIKIVKGPFRAEVDAATHTLGVFLGTTFVQQFPVGLGSDGGTPLGTWRVATKLKNPTYYPPRGGKIVAADDPENPLGERWIGLNGVSGEAVGQLRYGLHGTNEPDSIGQDVSLGCIRMHNEDVDALYSYLIENHSTVTVR